MYHASRHRRPRTWQTPRSCNASFSLWFGKVCGLRRAPLRTPFFPTRLFSASRLAVGIKLFSNVLYNSIKCIV